MTSASCYLPTMRLFTDTLLLPKWYCCAFFVSWVAVFHTFAKLRHAPVRSCHCLDIASASFVIATSTECLYVLTLALMNGVPSVGALGTFDNPAGLALNLCVAIPLGVHLAWRCGGRKVVRWLYVVMCLLMVATLCLTKSRTGMICLMLYLMVYLYRGLLRVHISSRAKRLVFAMLTLCLSVGGIFGVSQQKAFSTSGRSFIVQRSWELIREHPFIGHGVNGFEREYMQCQAKFFKAHPTSKYAILADEVHHPLNEFVYLWVNYGVLAPTILLGVMAMPYIAFVRCSCKTIKPLLLPLFSVFLFSCFSYPFHYPVAWIIMAICLGTIIRSGGRFLRYVLLLASVATIAYTVVDATYECRWNKAYRHSFRELNPIVLEEYEALHGYMQRNHHFLYNYAMTAFLAHDNGRAYALVAECGNLWNGYNRELLAGDICRKGQRYAEAICHYEQAMYMCPVRFAPLEGLYKTYEVTGDRNNKEHIAQIIAAKEVKVHSPTIQRIKNDYQ